jgi:hypothetical protein
VNIANTQNWGSFSAISQKFLPHLGHVANAFGVCGKRIWGMWQTHLGHVANAFGVQEGIRGSLGDSRHCLVFGAYFLSGSEFQDLALIGRFPIGNREIPYRL